MAKIMKNNIDFEVQLEILQSLNVGIIIIDTKMVIGYWNTFMSNHTGIESNTAVNRSLFDICPSLPSDYLLYKLKSVATLQSALMITWQQRPHLFPLTSYRSLTSVNKKMYHNTRIIPIVGESDNVEKIAIVIYDVTEAARAHLALEEKNRELTMSSRLDPLTSLYNRGYWENRLEAEFERYRRNKTPSVLVMLDIDHFKRVNDTYGHQGGDTVLRALGKLLTNQYRSTDIIGRYGGEEFGILLLDTKTPQALSLIKNLTEELKNTPIRHNKQEIRITLSFGLTEINSEISRHDQWIDIADKALYKSKQNGRNQATVLNYDV